MSLSELDQLLDDGRRNAAIAWLLVTVLAAAIVGIVVNAGRLWSLFALVLLGLALIPPAAYRTPRIMLPWEVLLMAALPVVGLALGSDVLSSQFAAYFAVAAIALVIAVELQSFTTIQLSPGFAAALVVISTMAAAALWGVAQWGFDVYLDTSYITPVDDPDQANANLMYEWIYSTIAGLFAGVVFTLYFRRRITMEDRVPDEMKDEVLGDQRGERL
ncbi:hypothetical protein SAMN06269185_1013 [Natronoarchaeum philippinense]|uniref:Uncharacterized protein n=1 Tax=Natronoarchaeum philippinense TaxID=558529 RepID=A0A285N990_NATPI|nr:hypothetical protein [Natronoarchaeum philippinense]SNZ06025.1 hypothetical protein SAMN06269185_1013 [Natronoarchaeum philippinense]